MQKIDFNSEYFNPEDVLECGQIFRFGKYKKRYLVISRDKACYLYSEDNKTVVECEDADSDYFYNFFDLSRDYGEINQKIKSFNVPVLTRSAELCKGLRLLNQDAEEMLFSFIISQNNNIPRIKGIIERLCRALGERRSFDGVEYFSFPTAAALSQKDAEFYKSLGAGYRDVFLAETSKRIAEEGLDALYPLNAAELKKQLLTYKGIGPKVADCVCLFGFSKGECFPVDTWIEKLYKEDFNGTLRDRNKINAYFTSLFKEYSGLVQQYLFYAKREGK